MTYIHTPVVIPPPDRPSPQARDLSNRLETTIREYEREHHDVSSRDVGMALDLIRQERAVQRPAVGMAMALSVGLSTLLVFAIVLFMLQR